MQSNFTGVYQSEMFGKIAGVHHGTTGRSIGNARTSEGRRAILKKVGLPDDLYVGVKQIHGAKVVIADTVVDPLLLEDADGLVTNISGRTLGIKTADCAPLLFVDPKARVIGAAHAGWKGTLSGIAGEVMRVMGSLGANPKNVLVWIGPHISACCYAVPAERAALFQEKFGKHDGIVKEDGPMWSVDIGIANKAALLEAGILAENVDLSEECTSCHVDRYYSYRKESKETYGEMLSFIGLTSNL